MHKMIYNVHKEGARPYGVLGCEENVSLTFTAEDQKRFKKALGRGEFGIGMLQDKQNLLPLYILRTLVELLCRRN